MTGFDPCSLFIDLIFGSIGFALFVYGKKADRWPQLAAGLLLMVYPYFVDSAVALFSIGGLIVVGLAGALWMGY
jgi:hypothetical protein